MATVKPGMPAVSAAQDVEEQTSTETKERLAPPWNVVVHDDPVTLMSYVTRVFRQVFGYSEQKARRLMLEVHESGRSVVWTGGREEAEVYVHKLQSYHLLTSLEPSST
jgi:ATP-dependent Clp protease adaptor protein ClpS